MRWLRRFDSGIARGEAAIATIVLLGMIVVAAAQALLRNLTNYDIAWANQALSTLEGADSFLQKGTLWLAFVGASLATHYDKQIAIDIVPRIAPPRMRSLMRGIVGVGAGVVCFFLASVFWSTVLINAQSRPLEYEVLVEAEGVHVCDAPAGIMKETRLERPTGFCAVRSFLGGLGAPVETPGAAAQLVVPAMFLIIGVRLFFKGIGGVVSLARGEGEGAEAIPGPLMDDSEKTD